MSWEGHITNFITGKEAQVSDGAIVCYTEGAESVYAGTEGLKKITAEEVKRLFVKDRSELFTNGVMIAGQKCRLVLDEITAAKDPFMNIITTDGCTICIAKADKVLVMAKGLPSIHGRLYLQAVLNWAEYMRNAGY